MGLILLAALIGVPLLEIAVFIQAGQLIGLWPTLGVVVLTAVLGTWQLRLQGLATLARARHEMDRGALPARELFDGACLLVAGALLLTPGFVTDAVGFLLFVPALRALLRETLGRRLAARMETRVYVRDAPPGTDPRTGPDGPPPGGPPPGGAAPRGPRRKRPAPVIEGEYDDVTEEVRR